MSRAWTLGNPVGYEKIIRIPGNRKAPGGYVFRSREEAEEHVRTHEDASDFAPYEIELPGRYEDSVTRYYREAALARHIWHRSEPEPRGYMAECGVCSPPLMLPDIDHDLLLVAAPFVVPDSDE